MLVALGLLGAACGDDDDAASSGDGSEQPSGADAEPSGTLRLGYFPNVTHAPAIIGVQEGIFEDAPVAASTSSSRPSTPAARAIEALIGGSIDATFIGPNPAINGYSQSDDLLRIVAGTTSGGASLVVRDGIDSPEDLEGTTLATPALGNTQDVALRAWLSEEGYETDQSGGGDVSITPQENPDTLTAFQDGSIDGAWLPEPWATRLVQEGDGHVLVDEADLWPEGQFVTTQLIVAKSYLDDHPENVRALISGLLDAIDAANETRPRRRRSPTTASRPTPPTACPTRPSRQRGRTSRSRRTRSPRRSRSPKDGAVEAGLLDDVDLGGIYDLTHPQRAAPGAR